MSASPVQPDAHHLDLQRKFRVADMMCTSHAGLRDRYAFRAFSLDLLTLAASTWLLALAFVEPRINVELTPFHLDPTIWVGILGAVTFFLTIVQMKTDWRGRSDAHRRALAIYAEVKHNCGYLIASDSITEREYQRVCARYDLASSVGVEVPEKDFLRYKRNHLVKVAISKHLDSHPHASIILLKLRFWWRDNVHHHGEAGQHG